MEKWKQKLSNENFHRKVHTLIYANFSLPFHMMKIKHWTRAPKAPLFCHLPNDINKLHAYCICQEMNFRFPLSTIHLFCFINIPLFHLFIWIDFILIWYGLWSNWIIPLRRGIFIFIFFYFSIAIDWLAWCIFVFRRIDIMVFKQFRSFILCFCHLNSNVRKSKNSQYFAALSMHTHFFFHFSCSGWRIAINCLIL